MMALQYVQIPEQCVSFPTRVHPNPTSSSSITIKNKQTQKIMFKIKTKRLNTYQVKPAKGIIEALAVKKIQFKIIKPLSSAQMEDIVSKDKFLIEIIILKGVDLPEQAKEAKETLSKIWVQTADKKELYESVTLHVAIQGIQPALKTVGNNFMQPLSPLKRQGTKLLKRLNSRKQQMTDQDLSRKFDVLKKKQQKLVDERQKLFKPERKSDSNISMGQICLLIFIFLFSVLVGNFLKLRVFVSNTDNIQL